MDAQNGFKVDDPDVFLPYSIGIEEARSLLESYGPKSVTERYFVLPCTALGLGLQLGLHFGHYNEPETKESRLLKRFELFFGEEEYVLHFGRRIKGLSNQACMVYERQPGPV